MNAPEKIYCGNNGHGNLSYSNQPFPNAVEYVRTDAFMEKALKWYCLDCECNDNCKDSKCFFHNEYERYLKGETNALPPKFTNRILNEDGSTSDDWRYRHYTQKMKEAFIEKAKKWIEENIEDYVSCDGEYNIEWSIIDDLKKAINK